jgi:polyhydroxyalkanoate synthesis repressor PhaR
MEPALEDTNAAKPVVVKKYANRRLYNTESSSYITLETLSAMVREGRDFAVFDAKTGEDITRSVLTQIIVEEESKGRAMLPTNFMRHLIGFYGDSLQPAMPPFLEQATSYFSNQQKQMRAAMEKTIGGFLPPGIEELGRQNMAMMERAMALFAPFYREAGHDSDADNVSAGRPEDGQSRELAALRDQVGRLQAELNSLRQETAVQTAVQTAAQMATPAQSVRLETRSKLPSGKTAASGG